MEISPIDRLFLHWKKQECLRFEAPLALADIATFSEKHGIELPSDFAAYLHRANGFWDSPLAGFDLSAMDHESFVFRPLDSIHLLDGRYLVFCTWFAGMVDFALCVDRSSRHGEVIKLADETSGYYLASSFSEFIELYITYSNTLYRAETPLRTLDGQLI